MALLMSRLLTDIVKRSCSFHLQPICNNAGQIGVLMKKIDSSESVLQRSSLHTTESLSWSKQLKGIMQRMPHEPKEWPKYNDVVYPPRQPGEPKRPAEVTHFVANVKYSTKKLWYLACLVRGLSIDEAIKQMSFQEKKGSAFIKRALEEAQEIAVVDHNVEYKSNLFVADSRALKGHTIQGFRKHLGTRMGVISYRYSHYLVRLREGKPPEQYYAREKTGYEKMDEYIQDKRNRTIRFSL